MVPSFFVYQEKFDLLSSGKIDRKKLQIAHFTQENQTKKTKTSPNTEIEEVIYNVWKDVLEIEEIGIYENFIRIGGNSLSAISITSRLKEILELEVSINDVFNYPNIQLYAEYIEEMITKLLNEN
ncbi:MAG: phosphopantetheine-binding protein [Polaribacter sp.]